MSAVIETEELTKRWGDVAAVDRLTIAVATGECYAFLGRNGAGKSTTARLLLDFIRPTSGSSRVLGGSGADPAIRRRIGYLPGDLNVARGMSGWDAFRYFGELGRGFDKMRVQSLVDRFGLDPTRSFHHLSTGNRRKVGLVLAFMSDPELLILDEPTSGLDPVLQQEFRTLLAERKADGATIWLTSHVMAEVEMVADRVGLIDDGKLAKELGMDELRGETTGVVAFTFAVPPDAAPFAAIPGATDLRVAGNDLSLKISGSAAPVLSEAGRQGALRVRTERRDLDDIFLELYASEHPGAKGE